jgi:fermentation-respiration switch protein FrsA (DUF1100 family)
MADWVSANYHESTVPGRSALWHHPRGGSWAAAPAGGTLAHTRAPSGKKLLLLERGDFLPNELANWDAGAVFVDGRCISSGTWYDSDASIFPSTGAVNPLR